MHPPSPAPLVDGPLPESLAEWKDLAESALRQLYAHKRQGLLDWPLVKGAINCAIVSCPIASHRAEMRALRDNGVYGSSMAPYLDAFNAAKYVIGIHVRLGFLVPGAGGHVLREGAAARLPRADRRRSLSLRRHLPGTVRQRRRGVAQDAPQRN